MKRILLLLPYANLHLEKLIQCLKTNFETDIYIQSSAKAHRTFLQENEMELSGISFLKLCNHYLNNKYDIIITHGLFYPYLWFLYLGRRSVVIVLSEQIRLPKNTPVKNKIKKAIVKRYAGKHCISIFELGPNSIGQQFSGLAEKSMRSYTYGYFPIIKSVPNSKSATSRPVRFIFAGQFIERKNISMLLEAAGLSNAVRNGDAIILLAGEGPLKGIVSEHKSVTYLGKLSKQQLSNQLNQSDVLILPSLYEGWGAIVNEACANGCALLISKEVMSGNLFLEENINGFIVPMNASSLADLIDYCSAHPEELNAMKKSSYDKSCKLNDQHDQLLISNINDAATHCNL